MISAKRVTFFFSCSLIYFFSGYLSGIDHQTDNETMSWEWPLKIANGYSSTFGEFRSSHFHVGLDLRTFQKTGFPVYAMADGVVEVIRKERRGTGLGVVMRHENGTYSFMYHLEALRDDLQSLLNAHIAAHLDPYPGNIELKGGVVLKAGEHFAYSGESGSGFPHLHIEIRNAKGQSINPFNLLHSPMADARKPQLHSLVIRARSDTLVNLERREWQTNLIRNQNGIFAIGESLILDGPSDWLLIGEDVSDSGRPVAPYSLRFGLDGKPLVNLCFNILNRKDNDQLGLVYDRQYTSMGRYAYALYSQPENTLYNIDPAEFEEQWSGMSIGKHEAVIEMKDWAGNSAIAKIPFFYFPHQSMRIECVSAEKRHFVLTGDEDIGPAILNIKAMNPSGKPLFTGQLPIDTLASPQQFILSDLSDQTQAIRFDLKQDGRIIWADILALTEYSPLIQNFEAVWSVNRDTVSLFYPNASQSDISFLCDTNRLLPKAIRTTPKGTYHIFSPDSDREISVLGRSTDGTKTSLVMLTPEKTHIWSSGGFQLEVRPASVNIRRLLKIDIPVVIEQQKYPVCSAAIMLSPAHIPLMKKARITLDISPLINPEQVGFFVSAGRGNHWSYLYTTQVKAGTFSADISCFGMKLALMRDVFPPVIGHGRLQSVRDGQRYFITVTDRGKGIDYRSISVRCADTELVSEYDPDWNRLEINIGGLKTGRHNLQVALKDYAANSARKEFSIQIR